MPVSYPAAVPTSGITSLTWTNATSSTISKSPFSFQGQAQSYGGAIRYAQITVADLNREDAEDWVGFLDSLNGTIGTFLFGDPMATSPMGIGGGSPTVLNSNFAGARDIVTAQTSYASTQIGWLRRGDWIQLGTGLNARLHKVLASVNVSSAGSSGNILVWPNLRVQPVTGQAIGLLSPKGLFRRSSGTYSYSEDNGCKYSLAFDCEEVI